jgi:HSP20 family protein
MPSRFPSDFMWSQAFDLMEKAERMHRQFFRLTSSAQAAPVWEPPVDVFEDGQEITIVVALPGVPEDQVHVAYEGDTLILRAQRPHPLAGEPRVVRHMEIPYGFFERRVRLPGARLEGGTRELRDGCLVIRLQKQR